MQTKSPKYAFQALLAIKAIPYKTQQGVTQIGTISISYNDTNETITFRDARKSHISFTTRYAMPSTILDKYFKFVQMMTNFKCGGGFMGQGINLN